MNIINKIKNWFKELFVENKTDLDTETIDANVTTQQNVQKNLTEGEDFVEAIAGKDNSNGFVNKVKVNTDKAKAAAEKSNKKGKSLAEKEKTE